MMSRVQKVVTKLEEWGFTSGLSLHSFKTEVVIFSKKLLNASQNPDNLQVSGLPVLFALSA